MYENLRYSITAPFYHEMEEYEAHDLSHQPMQELLFKLKETWNSFFFRITQYNEDAHNTHAHSHPSTVDGGINP